MKKWNVFLGAALSLSLVACGGAPNPGPGGGGSNPENAPVINSFKATDTTIALGGSTTLSWDVSKATRVSITADVGSSIGEVTNSSRVVTPLQDTVYTLTASNDAGDSKAEVEVTVTQPKTIAELVENDPQFSRLEQILAKADLMDTLESNGPYTLFAPNDAAVEYLLDTVLQISFEDFLKQPDLKDRFKFHILEGRVLADELEEGKPFVTLQGYPVTTEVAENGDLKVEAATVIEADVLATNGVVQVVDEPLQPPAKGRVEYTLDATSAAGTNVSGTARFNELSPTQTEVVLELTGVAAGTTLPAHIHEGDVDSNGAVKYPLTSVDGATGKSTTTLDVSYGDLLEFDGYLDVHLSEAQPEVVVANGEVGAGVVPPDLGRRAKATR